VSGVIVFVEHSASELDRLSREALALAGSLASATGGPVEAVLFDSGAADAALSLSACGVATAHVANDPRLDAYAPAAWAGAIVELMATRSPEAVIAGGSDRGHEVLALVAARTGRPLVTNVVEVTASLRGSRALHSEPVRNFAPSVFRQASLIMDGEISTPSTSYPARRRSRAQTPLPQPRSTTSPFVIRFRRRMLSNPGAAPKAKSLKPASCMYARSWL